MVKIKSVKVVRRGNNYQLHYYNLKGERRRISVGNNYQYAHKTAIKFYEMLIEIADKIFVINFTLSKGVSNAGIYHSSVYLLFNIFVV